MRLRGFIALAGALLILAAAAPGQAPGLCASLNDAPGGGNYYIPLVSGGDVYLGFSAPMSMPVDWIEIADSGSPLPGTISVTVHQLSGSTLGPAFAGGVSMPPSGGWIPLVLSATTSLWFGPYYVLRLTISSGAILLVGNLASSSGMQYVLSCGPNPPPLSPPCSIYPVFGNFDARLRFRAFACTPGPPQASTAQVGPGCGVGPSFPTLSTITMPLLGAAVFQLRVVSQNGGSIQIFWALGPATAGASLGLGGGCTSYLDPVSLLSLAAAGAEPLFAGPSTGVLTSFQTGLPASPSFAGTVFTTQAIIIGASGVPTSFGNVQLSNALQVTLGY